MLASDIPLKLTIPFANGASGTYRATIPVASQIGIADGRASLTDGFPPLNFQPIGSGGVPPFGKDVNGILYEISGWARWQQAGGPVTYDAAFSSAIGGYPAGAILSSNPAGNLWLCTADNNVTNPDAAGAGWIALIPGVLVKASAAECIAGTNDTHYVTPLGLAAALAAGAVDMSLTQTGWYTLPGGLLLQWGRHAMPAAATATISFPKPFTTACFSIVDGAGQLLTPATLVTGAITLTDFVVDNTAGAIGIYLWAALGH